MKEIQKEEYTAAARQRKRNKDQEKKLRKSVSLATQFFVSNRIKSKIHKTLSCLKVSVRWRSLQAESKSFEAIEEHEAREFNSDKKALENKLCRYIMQ